MKTLQILSLLLLLPLLSPALTLSSDARISVLTCSPGNELYSLFGHTAIRVNDPAQDMDSVFNYGTFDFATPHFYLKYAQGLLPYQLSISSYAGFLRNYQIENRSVYSQELLLDSAGKQQLFDLLAENYRPENRSYLYNFLFDNCTTRSRDIAERSFGGNVTWHMADKGKNFWNLLDEYLNVSPWVQWGIHSILGQPGTRTATTHEYMFLPDYLMYGLDSATHNGQRLVQPTEVIFRAAPEEISNPWYRHPFAVFTAGALLLILLLWRFRNRTLLNGITIPLFLFTGVLGALIIFLGFFTEHPITAPNWNILWANPLNLVALPFMCLRKPPRFIQWYLIVYISLLLIAIPVWFLAQPAVPLASLPLIFLLCYVVNRHLSRSRA